MEHGFWKSRWDEGRIGFHQADVNSELRSKARETFGEPPCRVLVPLCGKSRDMTWLAKHGYTVTGVEFVQDAVAAFFEEQDLPNSCEQTEIGPRYTGPGVTLYAADMFALTPAMEPSFDAIYDRAALIALPPEIRPRYATHTLGLLRTGGSLLLSTLEYDQEERPGPPFSVPKAEVEILYAGHSIEELGSSGIHRHERFGIDICNRLWAITRT